MQWQLFGWRTKFLRCRDLYGLDEQFLLAGDQNADVL